MRNPELQGQWEQSVRKRFNELKAERKYMVEYIIGLIARENFKEYRTIEAVVYGEYDRTRERRNEKRHRHMGGELFVQYA